MPNVRVPLTRSTLLETQRLLAVAREGHDLLDRKREVLLAELLSTIQAAEQGRAAMEASFKTAYEALIMSKMAVGVQGLQRAALAVRDRVDLKVAEHSIMGAVVPSIHSTPSTNRPSYSLGSTTVEVDRAAQAFRDLVGILCDAVERETTVLRLANEIRKTQRRVNALRNVVIPQMEEIIKVVREALEDAERESFYQAKMLKRQRGQAG